MLILELFHLIFHRVLLGLRGLACKVLMTIYLVAYSRATRVGVSNESLVVDLVTVEITGRRVSTQALCLGAVAAAMVQ